MILALLIASISQFGAFGLLLSIGFVYIAFSFLLGELSGDHDPDSPDHDGDIVSVFSPKVVAIFFVGFGAAGSLATHYGLSVVPAILWAFGGGVILGGLGYLLISALYRQQCSSDVNPSQAIGCFGSVATRIPPMGVGEINVTVAGQYMTYTARTVDGVQLDRGQRIKVAAVAGNDLLVTVS